MAVKIRTVASHKKTRGRKAVRKTGGTRCKPPESTIAIIDRLLMSPVRTSLNGREATITALAAIIYQLLQKETAGDGRASRVLLRYEALGRKSTVKQLEVKFPESDYTRSLAKRQPEHGDG
jgi:hypothetical protein